MEPLEMEMYGASMDLTTRISMQTYIKKLRQENEELESANRELRIVVDASHSTIDRAQWRWDEEHERSENLVVQVKDAGKLLANARLAEGHWMGKWYEEHDELVRVREQLNMTLQGVEVGNQLAGSYTFKSSRHTRPEDVEPMDAFAVTLVAVAGYDRDWTCYSGRAGKRAVAIAERGDKVPEACAEIFRGVMSTRYYRR